MLRYNERWMLSGSWIMIARFAAIIVWMHWRLHTLISRKCCLSTHCENNCWSALLGVKVELTKIRFLLEDLKCKHAHLIRENPAKIRKLETFWRNRGTTLVRLFVSAQLFPLDMSFTTLSPTVIVENKVRTENKVLMLKSGVRGKDKKK